MRTARTTSGEGALCQSVRDLIEACGDERSLIINLGNEQHGTREHVRRNVAAYRIVCDAYDFHVYEHYSKVRSVMRQYRDLMESTTR
ncbi:MAG: hypothetical protein AAF585_02080 [Verrucomicrobiota bacterium]